MADLKEIEREAAAERQELAKSLDALTNALAPQNLKTHAATMVETYGNDVARQAWDAAKKNPAGFVMVGAGLGLLLAGTGARTSAPDVETAQTVRPPQPHDALYGFDERVAAADQAMTAQKGSTMSKSPSAKWMRDRIEDGLDKLPPKARLRVREARQAAVNAQEKVEDQARRAARKSSAAMQSQPLAVGAVALGIGALIGALLPSSRREDELMGEQRDRFMSRAQGVLREEMDKLHAQAKTRINAPAGETPETVRPVPARH